MCAERNSRWRKVGWTQKSRVEWQCGRRGYSWDGGKWLRRDKVLEFFWRHRDLRDMRKWSGRRGGGYRCIVWRTLSVWGFTCTTNINNHLHFLPLILLALWHFIISLPCIPPMAYWTRIIWLIHLLFCSLVFGICKLTHPGFHIWWHRLPLVLVRHRNSRFRSTSHPNFGPS